MITVREFRNLINVGPQDFKRVFKKWEDDFDNDFEMLPNEMIKVFCEGKDDYDLLDFVLYAEDTPGHYNHVPLRFSEGDTGYSDKIKHIDIEENE